MKESNQQIIYWLYHPYFLNILTAPLQTPSPLRSAIHWNGYNVFLKLRCYLRYLGNDISSERITFSFIVGEPKSAWMSKKKKNNNNMAERSPHLQRWKQECLFCSQQQQLMSFTS